MNDFLIKHFSFMVTEYVQKVRWHGLRVRVDPYFPSGKSSYFLLNGHHVYLFNIILDLFIG